MHQLELLYLKLSIYYNPPPLPTPTSLLCRYKAKHLENVFPFSENAFAYRVDRVLSVHVLHSFFQLLVLHMKLWSQSYVVWDLKETR